MVILAEKTKHMDQLQNKSIFLALCMRRTVRFQIESITVISHCNKNTVLVENILKKTTRKDKESYLSLMANSS